MTVQSRRTTSLFAAIVLALVATTSARADVPIVTINLASVHPLPTNLNLDGAAIDPESQLVPCSEADRAKLGPDLHAVATLVLRAGGQRVLKRGAQLGKPIVTPDGVVFSLKTLPDGSYAVAIDSSYTQTIPADYFDACLKIAIGSRSAIQKLGLPLPRVNAGDTQYSPAIGFYQSGSLSP